MGIIVLLYIAGIIFSVLGIVLFFKVWGMCNDVREMKSDFQRLCARFECSEKNTDVSEVPTEKTKSSMTAARNTSGKFAVDQLVIIKKTEDQFRITSVIEQGDEILYFSEKFNKNFSENEIEDFDLYWANKKK